jgi:hypothetical protein
MTDGTSIFQDIERMADTLRRHPDRLAALAAYLTAELGHIVPAPEAPRYMGTVTNILGGDWTEVSQ